MTAGRSASGRSGQPLLALGGLLLCWIALRAALFELPREMLPTSVGGVRDLIGAVPPMDRRVPAPQSIAHAVDPGSAAGASRLALASPSQPRLAAGHNLLWMAAMQAIPLPAEIAAPIPAGEARAEPGSITRGTLAQRWSGDAWLALRSGMGSLAATGSPVPVYGGSQGGAVLRYSLAPNSRHRPAVYVRAVSALEARENDLAAGLSLRPFAAPLTAQVEARVTRRGNEVQLRPAAFLSTGVDALALPHGFAARGYAQGGYVGGRDATAFADGSLTAERMVLRGPDTTLTAGAGVWGGAQRGAARLDLGPSASVRFRLGEATGRVAVDYRLRVAGNAEPSAGAALTLSAGF